MLAYRFLRTAVAFFVVGVALGMYMGIRQDFRFIHVHAHLNLLGWVALGLAGLIYLQVPSLLRSRLAGAHYWLHTLGLLLFMGGFAWWRAGGEAMGPVIAAGASMVSVGVLLFAVNVFRSLPMSANPRG